MVVTVNRVQRKDNVNSIAQHYQYAFSHYGVHVSGITRRQYNRFHNITSTVFGLHDGDDVSDITSVPNRLPCFCGRKAACLLTYGYNARTESVCTTLSVRL